MSDLEITEDEEPPARLTIYGVEAPFNPDGFSTPDFQRLVDWYPDYCRASQTLGRPPADPQPFFTKACQGLEGLGVRGGRTADRWFERMIQHFGADWLAASARRMKARAQPYLANLPPTIHHKADITELVDRADLIYFAVVEDGRPFLKHWGATGFGPMTIAAADARLIQLAGRFCLALFAEWGVVVGGEYRRCGWWGNDPRSVNQPLPADR